MQMLSAILYALVKVFGLVIDSDNSHLCHLNQPPMNNQCEWMVSCTNTILAESKFLYLFHVTRHVFSIFPSPGPVLTHIPYL